MTNPTREAASYHPHIGTLPHGVIGYFRRLPDEELSAKDIALKFDAAPNSVHTNLKAAVDLGFLQRDGTIYTAGPNIGQREAGAKLAPKSPNTAQESASAAVLAPAAANRKSKSRYSAPRHFIDFTALKVDEGVPVAHSCRDSTCKWQPLFDKLTQPGQFIALPINVRGALAAVIQKRKKAGKGTYRLAMTDANTVRIWRLADAS